VVKEARVYHQLMAISIQRCVLSNSNQGPKSAHRIALVIGDNKVARIAISWQCVQQNADHGEHVLEGSSDWIGPSPKVVAHAATKPTVGSQHNPTWGDLHNGPPGASEAGEQLMPVPWFLRRTYHARWEDNTKICVFESAVYAMRSRQACPLRAQTLKGWASEEA